MKERASRGVSPYPNGRRSARENIEAGGRHCAMWWGTPRESEEKAKAIAAGRALLKRMLGRGWKLRVWQNLGWHHSAERGPLTVYPLHGRAGRHAGYHAMLSDDPKGTHSGAMAWTPRGTRQHRDPNKAAAEAVKLARAYLKQATRAVDLAEGRAQP